MRRSQVENALRTGIYTVLGEAKGGKHREVPLSAEAREMLTKRISNVSRGDRVFIEPSEKAHEVVNHIEKHLERHRELVTVSEGVSQRLSVTGDIKPLTFHGLRYNYVQSRMGELQQQGYSSDAAATFLTKEIGHERIDILKIYTNGQ